MKDEGGRWDAEASSDTKGTFARSDVGGERAAQGLTAQRFLKTPQPRR